MRVLLALAAFAALSSAAEATTSDELRAVLGGVGSEFVHRHPEPKFERVSWDFAMDRIARLMKDDRDKKFIAKNRDGVTVNRWLSTGFFGGSSLSNEAGYLTYKFVRATGILGFEDQARI